jgi:hypothetical protein
LRDRQNQLGASRLPPQLRHDEFRSDFDFDVALDQTDEVSGRSAAQLSGWFAMDRFLFDGQ